VHALLLRVRALAAAVRALVVTDPSRPRRGGEYPPKAPKARGEYEKGLPLGSGTYSPLAPLPWRGGEYEPQQSPLR